MARVIDTVDWTTYGAEMKDHLRITGTAQDTKLERYLLVVVEACDNYCDSEFVDEYGTDLDLPKSVLVGIFEGVRQCLGLEPRTAGLTSQSTGSMSESYDVSSRALDAIVMHCATYWRPYRACIFH